jgi:hypothetical protein
MTRKIVIHNHLPARDEAFAPGTRALFKGMEVIVEGPGPTPTTIAVRRADTKKGLTVERSYLKKIGT